jgi:hypothetical protein
MMKVRSILSRSLMTGALVLLLAPLAQAQEIPVAGFIFQGPDTRFTGTQVGADYVASRDLNSGIFPCNAGFLGGSLPPFCQGLPGNGFSGRVDVAPEAGSRFAATWTFEMTVRQTITAGSVDLSLFGLGVLALPFPGASGGVIVANGNLYTNCSVKQTLVATGDLNRTNPFTGEGLDITTTFGSTIYASWIITNGATGNSTCVAPDGRTVRVLGHGTVEYDQATGIPPIYKGVITFTDPPPPPATPTAPFLQIDTPSKGASVKGAFTVAGWTIDPAAKTTSGISAVHAYAYPASGAPIFLGSATLGVARPDVAAAFGSQYGTSGYGMTAPGLAPGNYTLVVYGLVTATGKFSAVQTANITSTGSSVLPSERTFTIPGLGIDIGAAFRAAQAVGAIR